MITFKQFISERIKVSPEITPVEIENGIELLNQHCKEALKAIYKSTGILFRGMRSDIITSDVTVIDTAKSFRTSRDTYNIYQVMMDSSSALKDYPSRSTSLICTTSYGEATSYGQAYVIIPFDGTKIAVSSENDFIDTHIGDVDMQLDEFEYLVHDSLFDRTRKTILRIEELDAKYKESEKISNLPDKLKEIAEKNPRSPFKAISDEVMTPKNLKLKLKTAGDDLGHNLECWFSGKCIVIKPRLFCEILLQLDDASKWKGSVKHLMDTVLGS